MNKYYNVMIDFRKFIDFSVDLRIPSHYTIIELLKKVNEVYNLNLTITNPCIKIKQTNEVVTSLKKFENLNHFKNGSILVVKEL